MAGFLGDLFNSFTGQQAEPQRTIIPLDQQLAQGGALLQSQILPQQIAYNQALAPAMTDIQLGVQNQIYGPQANQLQRNTYQSILDNLNLGESLSPALTADINRKLLESGAATGFGATRAGTGNVILQTGLQGERRGQIRRQEALGAVNQLPVSHYQYEPTNVAGMIGELGQGVQEQQAAQDELANTQEAIRRSNFSSLINTGGRILGGIAGGIFGGPLGASVGMSAGGSIFGGPSQGIGAQSGGGGFTSLLSGLGLGGGSQGAYADQLARVRASGVPALPV